jgi:hypothetical protein
MGAPAKNVPIALGALIIKERLGLPDEETVEHIWGNSYLHCIFDDREDGVPQGHKWARLAKLNGYLEPFYHPTARTYFFSDPKEEAA